MDTKLKLTLASLVVLVGLSQTDATATSTLSFRHGILTTHVVGQIGGRSKDTDRAQVEQLLSGARKAMAASDWALAESLVAKAEKKNVRFGIFHLGDTPQRVRRDLEKGRKKAGGAALPSQRYSPTTTSGDAQRDPFLDRDATRQQPIRAGNAQSPIELAASDRAADRIALPPQRTPSPAGVTSPFSNSGNSAPKPPLVTGNASVPGETPSKATPARQQSDAALLAARHALAVGDSQQALQHLEKAKALRVDYDFQEDSPAKVEAAIRKYTDVVGRSQGRRDTEGWRRQKAEVLMEQAEALLAWKDVKEAERLASDAKQLGVRYSPFEANPQSLLARIAKKRTSGAVPSRLPVALPDPTPSVAQTPTQKVSPAANDQKSMAVSLTQQARAALKQGDLARAGRLVQQAQSLQIPDSSFQPNEDRPWLVALDIQKAQQGQRAQGVTQAQYEPNSQDRYAERADYVPSQDKTSNVPAGSTTSGRYAAQLAQKAPTPGRLPVSEGQSSQDSVGLGLFKQGQQALRNQDKDAALRFFRQAYAQQDGLDPIIRQQLQDHLQLLSAGVAKAGSGQGAGSLLEDAAARQQMLARQLSAEVAKHQSDARRVREKDPKRALKSLEEMKAKVTDSGLDPAVRSQLLRRVDLSIGELERFVHDNRAQIELDEQNREVLDDIDRRRQNKVDVQEKLAELIQQFNDLVDEQQYEQAEVRAKQALELAPEESVARQVWRQARMLRRIRHSDASRDAKEEATWATLQDVYDSSSPFSDSRPYIHPDKQRWDELTSTRAEMMRRNNSSRRTERELEIERKLKTPVSLQFSDRPLAEVMDHLGKLTGVNVHLDPRGLSEEGVTSNTPVSISLNNEISLRSALNLILQPLHLSYVIKDEVLKITSEQMRDGETFTVTYNVADLVIPIPNFVPGSHLGMQGQLNDAYNALGYGSSPGSANPLSVVASNTGAGGTGMINPQVLAQMQGAGGGMMGGGGMGSGIGMGPGAGPGGLGGGAEADFDSLIELITATIQPNTWDEVGGPGSVKEFETNLSLVVSQTQDVHEEIVDLLEQLRRLQDLQVTIEVRFIRLSDNFFERIGVDFDFHVKNGSPETISSISATQRSTAPVDPSNTVGLTPNGFTSNLDLQFNQDSFTATVPQFGGFDPATAANFGFAILSDIEAYFLITAAQGDSRSNILQAPKVTLFNGQQAFVSDTSQTPFVISVIPVVGDFAAAQQPVIVVLSEGTFMTIQAVVSNDRRYVRLTVVPFFSQIRDVDTFTFEGSTTSTSASSAVGLDDNDNPTDTTNDDTTTTQGTTVQLPTFAFVTVTTTVSVPDGGTVLLGGIKRLSESRVETGVPILSKVPYVNRLFKNVGIGRDTESLMMMVTPRIIIQEEEEERLGIGGQ